MELRIQMHNALTMMRHSSYGRLDFTSAPNTQTPLNQQQDLYDIPRTHLQPQTGATLAGS